MFEPYRPTLITFPGQEKAIDSENPEKTLFDRIIEPFDKLVGQVENLRERVTMYGNSFGFFAVLAATEALTREGAKTLAHTRGEIVRKTENFFADQEIEAKLNGLDLTQLGRTGMMRLVQVPEQLRLSMMEKYSLFESNNYGGIVVLSGRRNALDQAAEEMDLPKRVAMLGVHAAYHDPIRTADSLEFKKVVEQTPIAKSKLPILTPTNARFIDHPDDIREELVGMITSPVKLEEILKAVRELGIQMTADFDPNESFSKLSSRMGDVKQWLEMHSPIRDLTFLQQLKAST